MPRMSTNKTPSSMPKQRELTDAQKGAILSLVPLYSHAKVGAQLGIPCRTVSNFVHRAQECESLENIPRPGRPRKLSDAAVRYLVRHAESETCIPIQRAKEPVEH